MSLSHRCFVYLLYFVFLFKLLRDKLLIITQVELAAVSTVL